LRGLRRGNRPAGGKLVRRTRVGIARQIVGHVEPADLFAAGSVPIRRIGLRIVEGADWHHLHRLPVPLAFPPERGSAGRAETAQHSRRGRIFRHAAAAKVDAFTVAHQPGHHRCTRRAAAPVAMAIGSLEWLALYPVTSRTAQTAAFDTVLAIQYWLPRFTPAHEPAVSIDFDTRPAQSVDDALEVGGITIRQHNAFSPD